MKAFGDARAGAMSTMDAAARRWHRWAGRAAAASTLVLVLLLFAFVFSTDAASIKARVLNAAFLVWCTTAVGVLVAYVASGTIISTLGLHFSHLQVIRRRETPLHFWLWWTLFSTLLVLLGLLLRIAIAFVVSMKMST